MRIICGSTAAVRLVVVVLEMSCSLESAGRERSSQWRLLVIIPMWGRRRRKTCRRQLRLLHGEIRLLIELYSNSIT